MKARALRMTLGKLLFIVYCLVGPKFTSEACRCNIDNREWGLLFATYLKKMSKIQWTHSHYSTMMSE